MLKKIALAFVATGFLAGTAIACPNSDHEQTQTPKVAEKDKAPAKTAPAKKAPAKKAPAKTTTVAKK